MLECRVGTGTACWDALPCMSALCTWYEVLSKIQRGRSIGSRGLACNTSWVATMRLLIVDNGDDDGDGPRCRDE